MGSLSQQEQEAEFAFLNPMSNHLANSMRGVIKQKVHSALCNDDQVEAYNKAMYVGKRYLKRDDPEYEYDDDNQTTKMIDDPKCAQRTHHADIQPSAIRIQAYKHKQFGKKYQDAVE